jgi:hypothetical protein
MKRREFIAAATAALLVSPPRLRAQGTPRRIGFLGAWADEPARDPAHAAWLSGLREKGWIEGKNLLVEYRFAPDRLPALAVEPQQVVLGQTEAADWRLRFYPPVRPMPVVSMKPVGQFLGAAV